jgi:hypothetical protein
MVCSLLRDFHHSFAMISLFFWAFFLAITRSFLGGWMRWQGDFGTVYRRNRVWQEEDEDEGGGGE